MNKIAKQLLIGAGEAVPVGQVVLLAGTTSWTVPAGVTSISIVAVQRGLSASGSNGASVLIRPSPLAVLCRAWHSGSVGTASFPGGLGYTVPGIQPGAGGAGGYSGAGGNGDSGSGAGAGNGGGGSGGGRVSPPGAGLGRPGGGVGLFGQGASGSAPGPGSPGNPGSAGTGATYGGGSGYFDIGGTGYSYPGGSLAYSNDVAVTPGEVLTVAIEGAVADSNAGPGAIRIIWPGTVRQFPSTRTADE